MNDYQFILENNYGFQAINGAGVNVPRVGSAYVETDYILTNYSTNLGFYWKGGEITDSSINGSNAFFSGTQVLTTGVKGESNGAFNLNGAATYLSTYGTCGSPLNFTFMGWGKANNWDALAGSYSSTGMVLCISGNIADKNNYCGLGYSKLGSIWFRNDVTNYYYSNIPLEDSWHLYTMVGSLKTISVYVDNLFIGSRTSSDAYDTLNGNIRVGIDQNRVSPLSGNVGFISFWGTQLSLSDISGIYNNTKT